LPSSTCYPLNSSAVQRQPGRGRYTLALIFLVGVVPLLGSYALYLFWRPAKFVNYGELIEPVPLAEVVLSERGGGEFRFGELRGRWVLLTVDRGACDSHCRQKLLHMRQVRLAQGADQDRVERLWLVSDGLRPPAGLDREFHGTRTVLLEERGFLARLPAVRSPSEHIYLVDPMGNLMMRFPHLADPNRMKKDLGRLLRLSQGWRQIRR
jgi:cytochrome oxidase Cu insertion factor (SCO1/SenC/PrrC family)